MLKQVRVDFDIAATKSTMGSKFDLDLQGQKLGSYANPFNICISQNVCTHVINHGETNVTLTFNIKDQYSTANALNHDMSQRIGWWKL